MGRGEECDVSGKSDRSAEPHGAASQQRGETPAIPDFEQLTLNAARALEQAGKAAAAYVRPRETGEKPLAPSAEANDMAKTFGKVAEYWMKDPARALDAQSRITTSMLDLWSHTLRKMQGETPEPIAAPEPRDGRFKHADWSENPYFDFLKQAYLVSSRWADQLVAEAEVDEHTKQKAGFYVKQLAGALSPSNFVATNPELLQTTLKENGENLVRGLRMLAEDMEAGHGDLKIRQSKTEGFEVGVNMATTPGKVVFRNDLIELIQYAPATEKVLRTPLVIVPPWINKYYILDLTPAKSFVKYAVEQGFTVFLVSWVNPDESLSHKTFEDYMIEGLLNAADAVKREAGTSQTNVLGYCVGGTLLGSTLAYLAARGEAPFRSATFLTTQVDFSKAGDLLLFTNDAQLTALEEMMAERGYLDGSRMANVFNMMRPKDLIWPYIVNNYLLGKKPFPFDLLYWNQDSTRMAAANHSFYLREFYNENRLTRGEMTLAGTRLNLGKVKLPVYELATKEDHIAPAKSVFIGARSFGGPVEFVLAGSGHIAGVVNPPDKVKYQYWTAPKAAADTLEEWMEMAKEHPGSWWPHWAEWLARHSGNWTVPREPGERLGVIEAAPGSYVKAKS
jgi:polyhydroxyalkanoate synthase